MSAATLERLMPIHLYRERRALTAYREYQQAHDLARAAQTQALRTLEQLERSAAGALGQVLDGGAMSAGDAQAALDEVHAIEHHVASTRKRLHRLDRQVEEARALAEEARRAYAARVRATHKIKEACRQQGQRENRLPAQRAEQGVDDDFSTRWQPASLQRTAA